MKHFVRVVIFFMMTGFLPVSADIERLMSRADRYFDSLPEKMPGSEQDTVEKIALGRTLFFDKRLSISDNQACVSCHRLEDGFAGVDNLSLSPGAGGDVGTRNSPTVLNAGFQQNQFWDGRAKDLVEQAKGPILNPVEMAMPDERAVEQKLQKLEGYQNAFSNAFPDTLQPVTFQHIAEAIAAFERTLITRSRFDDFLDGNVTALNKNEQRGLDAFIKLDCVYCHDGVLLGGATMETLGAKNPYENQSDTGLYALTKDETDRMVFKVASLRNVALTAPYFHDGRIKTLQEAVKLMAKLQLDEDITDEQVEDITSFLKSLTDIGREKH